MPRDTRESILDAALEVFSERGFHGASVPDVAQRAGVGVGSIYRHFTNKEGLGNALYVRWKTRYVEEVLDALPTHGSWRERFHGIWEGMVGFALAHPGVLEYLEFHHHSSYLDEQSAQISARMGTRMREMIESGQADGVFVDAPVPLLLNMVYGSFIRLVRAGAAGAIELTPELFALAEERAWAMIRR
jgi:AcrR family transcriptional regulator